LWDDGVEASDAATLAGVKALADAGIDPSRIGLLVNTSVSRDYLEPSTASIVSGNLGLSDTCQNFDVANACLAFLNGMDIASRMIERGEIDYALIVDGETANLAYEKTLNRMASPDLTEDEFRNEMATLTLGCGAAGMVLARAELAPGAPRYRGGVTRAATQWNTLCRGNLDRMVTDTKMLLIEGMKLASKTFAAAKLALGWAADEVDEFVIHQVSKVHTLRRARQHRPGLGADRAQQTARDGAAEERRSRRPAWHRLRPELLDGRSGLVKLGSDEALSCGDRRRYSDPQAPGPSGGFRFGLQHRNSP
jgi:acyl-CoA:acyl-CoA alkyltransferase